MTASDPTSVGRPEAVVRALQILEVREQLERDRTTTVGGVASSNGVGTDSLTTSGVGGSANAGVEALTTEHMDDGEKALVREMCNVVWRKLEESPNGSGMDPM